MKLCFFILFLVSILPGIPQEIKYPGSWLSLEEEARSAEDVFIAEFENLGIADVGSGGSTHYGNAILGIRRNFINQHSKWHFIIRDAKALVCSYSVQTVFPTSKEEAPTFGKEFLMLGKFSGGIFFVSKIVEPTGANVELVEKVLRARGIEISSNIKVPPVSDEQDDAKYQPAQSATPSSVMWSIIVVLSMAVLGLLWLLLKRRS